ncbi:MAG: hypothetical protein PHW75_03190, partial [Patescibacteria group bacterium]|nr:hypothetical protein [Patescibacteria group bacterium]
MKESQQKVRIAMEMMTRLARQAEKVSVSLDGNTLDLYFDIEEDSRSGVRFEIDDSNTGDTIEDNTLTYSECSSNNMSDTGVICNLWSDPIDLLGDSIYIKNVADADSNFTKVGSIPPSLEFNLYTKIGTETTSSYYSDEMTLETEIILENLK